jgi:hypothetical protein
MDDILCNIVDHKLVIEEIEDGKIICYSTKNTIVSKTLHEISGLIQDVCGIISEYYNAIIINKHKYEYTMEDEYINFKKINCSIIVAIYYSNGFQSDCVICTGEINDPTVFTYTNDMHLITLNTYMEKKYKITNFFNNYNEMILHKPIIKIDNDKILIKEYGKERCVYILDDELFTLLIIIIKKIFDMSNKKLNNKMH